MFKLAFCRGNNGGSDGDHRKSDESCLLGLYSCRYCSTGGPASKCGAGLLWNVKTSIGQEGLPGNIYDVPSLTHNTLPPSDEAYGVC